MKEISTCDICDEYADSVHVIEPMFAPFGGRDAFYGKVVTVKAYEDNSKVRELVSSEGKGQVLVVDAGGSLKRAMLGDMLAGRASDMGWAGVIIHGCIRDVVAMSSIDLGVYALASNPLPTEKKGIGEINVDVTFGGVTIKPGCYLYADLDGLLVSDNELDLDQLP